MPKLRSSRLLGAVLMVPAIAMACGACIEDKMAATYDYQVTQQAAARHLAVVYCDVQGQVDAQVLLQAAKQVPGLDASTVRTSREPAAMSFALDTDLTNSQAAAAKLTSQLQGRATVVPVRIVGPASDATTAPKVPTARNLQE